MTEIVKESPQLPNSVESSFAFPVISGDSIPIQTSGASELVINVQDATAQYNNNDPHVSQLRLFGHKTSIVDREIDKIFTWQSKRMSFIDPPSQSKASAQGEKKVTSVASKYPKFLRKVNDIIQNIKETKYYMLMKFILIAVPISACYMGASYECPISEVTPCLLQLIGVFGIFLILSRITTAFKRQLSSTTIMVLEYTSIGVSWCLGIALFIEMIPFYNLSPNLENSLSRKYCHKTFYYYTYYMNIVALVIGFVALLLHTPCFKETTEIAYIRMGEMDIHSVLT